MPTKEQQHDINKIMQALRQNINFNQYNNSDELLNEIEIFLNENADFYKCLPKDNSYFGGSAATNTRLISIGFNIFLAEGIDLIFSLLLKNIKTANTSLMVSAWYLLQVMSSFTMQGIYMTLNMDGAEICPSSILKATRIDINAILISDDPHKFEKIRDELMRENHLLSQCFIKYLADNKSGSAGILAGNLLGGTYKLAANSFNFFGNTPIGTLGTEIVRITTPILGEYGARFWQFPSSAKTYQAKIKELEETFSTESSLLN